MTRGRRNPRHFGLAARLKKARQEAKIARSRLALDAGLADRVVSYIEVEGGVPGVDTVEKIARALRISPGFLSYGIEGPPIEGDALRCEGIGPRLAMVRKAQGLSKAALAEKAQIARTAVLYIEEGKVKDGAIRPILPSVATAESLASALSISPCWLAFGEGPQELKRPPRRRGGADHL